MAKQRRSTETAGDLAPWPTPGGGLPDLAAAFTPGAVVAGRGGRRLRVRRALAGTLTTKGRVVVNDPGVSPDGAPLPFDVPAGAHEVFVSLVTPEDGEEGGDPDPAAAALVLSSAPPVRWERVHIYDVDSGLAAFMDLEAADRLDDGDCSERVSEALGGEAVDEFVALAVARRGKTDVVAVRSGIGDGTYVVYAGRDAAGAVAAVVTGFGLLAGDEPDPAAPRAGRRERPPKLRDLLHAFARLAGGDQFDRRAAAALAELTTEDVELVVDGGPPARGRERALELLRTAALGDIAMQDATTEGVTARAPFTWGRAAAAGAPRGELEVVAQGQLVRRAALTRPVPTAEASVPALAGQTHADAQRALLAAGYRLAFVTTRHADAPVDTVLGQSPPPGTRWAPGSAVRLELSRGPLEHAIVPDVRGLDEAAAASAVAAARLFLHRAEPVEHAGPSGRVAAQDPEPGRAVPVGTPVKVAFPVERPAEQTVFLPSLAGLSLADAEKRLKLFGLKKGKVRHQPGPGAEGAVLATEPPGGGEVPARSKVDLIVCKR